MPRIYIKKGTRKGEVNEEAVKTAMKEILEKTLSIRKSAKKYGIKPTTLQSRVTKYHNEIAAEENVFTTEEETLLNKYIAKSSKEHYELTTIQVRELAYNFAKVNQLHYPPSWNHNRMAGQVWLDSYRRRNEILSLKKPENTISAAKSYGFNQTAVNDFYENPEKARTENTKKTISEGHSRTSSVFTDVDSISIDIKNEPALLLSDAKDETYSFTSADENLPSVSHLDYHSQEESRPATLLGKTASNKRSRQTFETEQIEDEDKDEEENDLVSLKKSKLRLEIYNLKLDALKKEIDLGISRSQFTADLCKNWDVPIKEEI